MMATIMIGTASSAPLARTKCRQLLVCLLVILGISNGFVLRTPARTTSVSQLYHPTSKASAARPLRRRTTPQHHLQQQQRRKNLQRTTSSSSSSILQMVQYQDLLEKMPSAAVVRAVEKNSGVAGNNNQGVIASDVAAAAGVSLSQARQDLTALASLSQGDIAVNADGELIYTFPPNLGAVLSSNSAKYQALASFQKAWPRLFWFIRVSFGVTLLVSLAAIFSAIVFIQTSSSSSDRDRDDRRGGGGGMMPGFGGSYMWGPSPFDFFYWNRPYGYYTTRPQDRMDPDEMGFLPSIFSYVFGDGDPNAGLEERRLSLVANLIRNNKGAVTAEQLAPFCDDAPKPSTFQEATYVDEAFVLPIVTALNGEPQVTEDGDIVYVFPELQISASSSSSSLTTSRKEMAAQQEGLVLKRAGLSSNASTREIKRLLEYNRINTRGALERSDLIEVLEDVLPPPTAAEQAALNEFVADSQTDVLQEKEVPFSIATDLNRFLAAGLGVLNLGGALYLGNLLAQPALYGVRLPSYMGLIQAGYPLLLAYAILFNAIPAVRYIWTKRQNEQIEARNKIRQDWKKTLGQVLGKAAARDTKLGRKLRAASKMGTRTRKVGRQQDDDIVFDTSKPLEENQKKRDQKALEEFDKLLENNDDNSSFQ